MIQHELFMKQAISHAHTCLYESDVPVGCVIVCENEIIAYGYNTREKTQNALGHAEIMAINNACKKLGNWRLDTCDIYVTLEPCPMCMGAIINARINRVIFGAKSFTYGCCGTLINLSAVDFATHPKIIGGILQDECEMLLKNITAK